MSIGIQGKGHETKLLAGYSVLWDLWPEFEFLMVFSLCICRGYMTIFVCVA